MTETGPREGKQRERARSLLRRKPEAPPPQKGWKVTPAPDGRGEPPQQRHDGPLRRYGRPLLILSVVLLALNWYAASRVTGPPERLRIPYSPLFLSQVDAGNVESITSRLSTLQGDFKKSVKYPATGEDAHSSKRFETEIPSFANTDQLFELLRTKKVVVNAEPPDEGAPWWHSLLFGFGPTLRLHRPARLHLPPHVAGRAAARSVRSGGRARSATRERRARDVRGRGRHRRGRRTSWRRSSTSSRTRTSTAGSAARSRAASCWSARPAPARRCWPARSPARPASRSSRCPPPSSSR